MRLGSIKLAGFKSFVDPTVLELPSNMTSVVGPNGCGKSNIIDAVKWVMGESAASRLRGDAITDVIFNGSTERKPVGQAAVELIFDNSDGQIGGEYSAYGEISVKRVVGRDAVSNYYLNGSRCRRRDITDLFLGTGLGPRSYAIIEQGMISQIVEAAPEDLRVHLEEAAGISKYKERRKETESRIRATRENLSRLDDVRQEIDKQLDHLRRQARQAERYTELKQQFVQVEAELRTLQIRDLDVDQAKQNEAEHAARLRVDQLSAEQRQLEADMEKALVEHTDAGEAFNQTQGQHYAVGSDLARVEQQLEFGRQAVQRLSTDQNNLQARMQRLEEQHELDAKALAAAETALAQAEPAAAKAAESGGELQGQAEAAEQALAAAQQAYEAQSRELADAQRKAEVERTRIEFQEKQQRQHLERRDAIARELKSLDPGAQQAQVEQAQKQEQSLQAEVERLGTALEQAKSESEQSAASLNTEQSTLAQFRQGLQAVRGRLASLETLQHAALGQDRKDLVAWLERQGLAAAPRLGALLKVDEGWTSAVESVLGPLLEAVVVPAAHAAELSLDQLPKGTLTLVGGSAATVVPKNTLAAKVRGPAAVTAWLGQIQIADSEADARARAASLSADASIVTADGFWIGPSWLRVDRGAAAHEGVLARSREIEALGLERHGLEDAVREAEEQIQRHRQAVQAADARRSEQQQALYQVHRKLAEAAAAVKSASNQAEAAARRVAALNAEERELKQRISDEDRLVKEARARLGEAISSLEALRTTQPQAEQARRQAQQVVEGIRQQLRNQREQTHRLALEIEAQRSRKQGLTATMARAQSERADAEQRRQGLDAQLLQAKEPIPALKAELERHLERKVQVEIELAKARSRLEVASQQLRQLEQGRQRIDQLLGHAREKLSEQLLKTQAVSIKRDDMATVLTESGQNYEALLESLSADAVAGDWQSRAIDLEQKIRRLEPVNLAAISELAQLTERKTYLDSQHADLSSAMETLEAAIGRIDRETRTRFKDTFDKVSTGLKELFPRLFGGGHAYLELTGEDLLSTGVTIMARPPGKRISNIGLLSGGEKALTAVALVFAIFRLNPAPFCLLDEVDAPLDEANVGRFSEMVVEMSKTVQFLVVTHNKVTMEAANQLAGVTMREPGVSRLVSVDLSEAARMVG